MLSASFQLCLASSHVIFLTCALCLVLINILLKRVKRSSWFTSAKTRGHLVELVSISDIFSKPPSKNKPLCYWNEMFLKQGDKKYTKSGYKQTQGTPALDNSYISLKLVRWELAGQKTEGQSPSWDTVFTLRSPLAGPKCGPFTHSGDFSSRQHRSWALFPKLSQGQKHHEGCYCNWINIVIFPTNCSRMWMCKKRRWVGRVGGLEKSREFWKSWVLRNGGQAPALQGKKQEGLLSRWGAWGKVTSSHKEP